MEILKTRQKPVDMLDLEAGVLVKDTPSTKFRLMNTHKHTQTLSLDGYSKISNSK